MPLPATIANPALAAYTQANRRAEGSVGNNQASAAPSFGAVLANTVDNAIDTSKKSESISIQAASGQSDLQDVVEAVNAAEIGLQTVVSLRDRMVSAYQEILRMPI